MAENDTTQSPESAGRPGAATAPEAKSPAPKAADQKAIDYAFWELPGSSFKVIYSLSLFHEIDFVVNEGYRKIPHGGIEEGGLLFGKVEAECIRIEAYRSIECEHASGPSFVLSDRDMTKVEAQLMASSSDPDLEHLSPLGWFLAHTRGPLTLTDLEVIQFDRLFPQVSRTTVLIKPERFQPTRFGFLVRDANRSMPRDAATGAIILPLPGRSSKQGTNLIPSIPAPALSVNARRLSEAADAGSSPEPLPRRKSSSDRGKLQPEPANEPVRPSIWKVQPAPEETEDDIAVAARDRSTVPPPMEDPRFRSEPEAEERPEERTDAQRAARKQLARDRARVMEEALEVPIRPAKAQPPPPAFSVPRPLPERTVSQEVYQQLEEFEAKSSGQIVNARSLSVLSVAALLGCLVGYIGYLQLPAPVIPLEVHGHSQTIKISWPVEETRNAIFASIRVNNSEPIALSADERLAGELELNAGGDVKVEVIARNWMRDSRGIVRYLRSANGNASMLPSDSH